MGARKRKRAQNERDRQIGRRSSQAAAYDRWFRVQIGEALREAADPNALPSISSDRAKEMMARQREALSAKFSKSRG